MTFKDVVRIILEGATYDLIKSGSSSFVLKPFIYAYNRLKSKNQNSSLNIEQLSIAFQDVTLYIDQIGEENVINQLDKILPALAANYDDLMLKSGEQPVEIYIPVFEDPGEDRLSKFRVVLDVDETIQEFKAADYLTYWGIYHDYAHQWRVYDVVNKRLLDDEFCTRKMYEEAFKYRGT